MSTTLESVEIRPACEFDVKAPRPGVYRGVPAEDYFAARAWNHSTLRVLAKQTPAHALAAWEAPEHKESDAMRLGTLAHTMLFEPETLADRVVNPPINPRTQKPFGSDSDTWAKHAAANPGKLIVSAEELERTGRMVLRVKQHPKLVDLFGLATERELVVVAVIGGVLVKVRLDSVVPGALITDLKTCIDASEMVFASKMIDYGYYTQAAIYMMVANRAGLGVHRFVFGLVESVGRFETAAYTPSDIFLGAGEREVERWIGIVAECERSGHWPSYPTNIIEIHPPMWFVGKFADGE